MKREQRPKRGLPPYDAFESPNRIVFNLPIASTNKTQTVSDRINARPRKRPLNITRKHEKKEFNLKFVSHIFLNDQYIIRYNNDLMPRPIKIY